MSILQFYQVGQAGLACATMSSPSSLRSLDQSNSRGASCRQIAAAAADGQRNAQGQTASSGMALSRLSPLCASAAERHGSRRRQAQHSHTALSHLEAERIVEAISSAQTFLTRQLTAPTLSASCIESTSWKVQVPITRLVGQHSRLW